MIDLSKTYRTRRHGREVELDCIKHGRVWGRVKNADGKWLGCNWSAGTGAVAPAIMDGLDLVEVKQKRVVWLNGYSTGEAFTYSTREQADRASGPERIACLRIEYEEGEGL
jgi:hypothetical protein